MQEFSNLTADGKSGLANNRGLSDSVNDSIGLLRHNLARATMAKQTLEYEKSELKKRIDDLEKDVRTEFPGDKKVIIFKVTMDFTKSTSDLLTNVNAVLLCFISDKSPVFPVKFILKEETRNICF